MSRDIAPFGLRTPADLKKWLTEQAKLNNRSLNAEIVTRLQQMQEQQTIHNKLDKILEILEK